MSILDTFDVWNVTANSGLNGNVCFIVDYVEGHETPPRCFVRLTCTRHEYNQMIEGISGCINNVPPNESCNLTATDGDDDAVRKINTIAPVTITGITIPSYIAAQSTTFAIPPATPTPTSTG